MRTSGIFQRIRQWFRPPQTAFRLPAGAARKWLRNPLPGAFPGMFTGQPGEPAVFPLIERDATELVRELVGWSATPARLRDMQHNLQLILAIPTAGELLTRLPRLGLERYYRRDLLLAMLAQQCIFDGTSETARSLWPFLPYMLLGICLRHIEVPYLAADIRQILSARQEFDLHDVESARSRKKMLDHIRTIEEKMVAQKGMWRFIHFAEPTRHEQIANLTAAIIRYSGRLTGRTATGYDRNMLWRIPEQVVYLELLDNVASAWLGKKKLPMLVLAEEYSRLHTDHKHRVLGELCNRSLDALHDLQKLFGIECLPDFQGTGRDAFYMPGQQLLARVEAADSNAHLSVRRFKHARSETSERSHHSRRSRRSKRGHANDGKTPISWKCYRLNVRIPLDERRRLEPKGKAYTIDPPESALQPYTTDLMKEIESRLA